MKTMGSSKPSYPLIDKSGPEPKEDVKRTDDGLVDWEYELKKRVSDSDSEVEQEVEGIVEKYDGLVSMEAAPILVAKEKYDLDLLGEVREASTGNEGEIEIDNIVPGMRSLDLKASVAVVKDEFTKDGADWRVRNLVLKDASGKTEIAFWNEDSDKVEDLHGNNRERIVIEGAYTKEDTDDWQMDNYGVPAINTGDSTTVKIVDLETGEERTIISPDE